MKATIEVTIVRKYEVEISGYDDAQEKAKKLQREIESKETGQGKAPCEYGTVQVTADVVFVDMNW